MIESLVVEFDYEKYEELLSSGSVSPKTHGNTTKSLGRLALKSLRKLL